MRRLTVYWHRGEERVRVGELGERAGSPIMFEWDRGFLQNGVELSPISFKRQQALHVCPREPFEGLPGLFADHLPDGWGRILLRRVRERQGISLSALSPLDHLAHLGQKTMGALSFEPSLDPQESWTDGEVSLEKLSAGVVPILEGSPSDVLGEFLRGGASPQGIRPKIIVKRVGMKLYLGSRHVEAAEWMVKFQSPVDSAHSGAIEYVYALMAKGAGLEIAQVDLLECKHGRFFASKRFDRVAAGGRLHLHSLSGLLHRHPAEYSISYGDLARVTQLLTRAPKQLERVFQLAAFNVLASNQDDHTRNVAFLMDSQGAWTLAPAFDLTFFRGSPPEHKMTVLNHGAPTLEVLKSFGAYVGLRPARVRALLDAITGALQEFPRYASEYGIPRKVATEIANALPIKRAREPVATRKRASKRPLRRRPGKTRTKR